MKFYPAKNMGFFDTVQAFFLEMTGRGMVLSARDIELLMRWRDHGASPAVICQGIDRAVSAMEDRPRDIWACRYHIEPLVERARRSATGRASSNEETPDETEDTGDYAEILLKHALEAVEEAGARCEEERFREIYREAWRTLKSVEHEDALTEISALDEAIMSAFFKALEDDEQDQIDERIKSANRALLRSMSASARQRHLEVHRRRLLRQEYNLPSLLELR